MRKLALIVDDEPSIRTTLKIALLSEFDCLSAKDLSEAKGLVTAEEVDLILLDIRIGTESGIDFLRFLARNGISRPVICISGEASYKEAIEAYQLGALDFLEKPITQQALDVAVRRCITAHEFKERQRALMDGSPGDASRLIGESPPIKFLYEQIEKVGPTDAKVLILGETGTGKEIVAASIHRLSKRSKKPFIVVDCASLPPTLMESTLFGHRKGAFTGADSDQAGRLECAEGGTLFLDEIGELGLEGQNRLLRFLETGKFQRVGSSKVQAVDTRIIAATSRDLPSLVASGKFRSDLFFRLNVITVRAPSLRDLGEDIPAIFEFHYVRLCGRAGNEIQSLTSGDREALRRHPWPGNVRELRNVAERAAIVGLRSAIAGVGGNPSPHGPADEIDGDFISLRAFRAMTEKKYISRVLGHAGGNVTKAAGILEIDRVSLHQKINQYGIERLSPG